jgi:hypothetical protein
VELLRIWKVECGMWNVECGKWNLECGKWKVECGMWKVECGMWNVSPYLDCLISTTGDGTVRQTMLIKNLTN